MVLNIPKFTFKIKILLVLVFCVFKVQGQIQANYSSNVISGCSPLTVNFSDASTGSPIKWEWTFGNGNQSVLKNPSAIYYQPGNYSVQLKVWDAQNNTSTVQTLTIRVFKNPVADFTQNKVKVCENASINFSDLSKKGDTTINFWQWDFGDGKVLNTQNPSYAYTNAGIYTVNLQVRDRNGCSNIIEKKNLITIDTTPKSNFSVSKYSVCKFPVNVTFINSTTPNNNSNTYFWDFGNGITSTQKSPSFKYTQEGNYNVSLKTTSSNGCVNDVLVKNAVSIFPIKAKFSLTKTQYCVGDVIGIVNETKESGSVLYTWTFGDGTTLYPKDPQKKYFKPGLYEIQLITKENDCSDTFIFPSKIRINDQPKANIILNDTLFCETNSILSLKTSGAGISKINYKIKDFAVSASNNQEIKYNLTQFGEYPITVFVEDYYGCKDTFYKLAEVNKPFADFLPADTGSCAPYVVDFKNLTQSKYKVIEWHWELEENVESSEFEPDYIYTQISQNNVKLTATDEKGCTGDTTFYINVGIKIKPTFKADTFITCNRRSYDIENTTQSEHINKVNWTWNVADEVSKSFHFKESFHKEPKKYNAVLISDFNGCKDTTTKKDFFEILNPYGTIEKVLFDTCNTKNNLELKAKLTGAHRFYWEIDNKIYYDSVLKFQFDYPKKYRLNSFNDSNLCSDYEDLELNIMEKSVVAIINKSVIGSCFPQKLVLNAMYEDEKQNYYWYVNNQLLSQQTNYEININRSSNFNIKLLQKGYEVCADSAETTYSVQLTSLVSSFSSQGNCLPIKVKLSDSNFNSQNNYWLINKKDTLRSDALTKNLEIKELPENFDGFLYFELKTLSNLDCQGMQEYKVKIESPQVKIIKSSTAYCDFQTVNFKAVVDTSTNKGPFKYKWLLPDGSLSYRSEDYAAIYDADTLKTILEVSDIYGCKTILEDVAFYPASYIKIDFDANPKGKFCPPLLTNFVDLSSSRFAIAKWEWDFGDESKSYLRNPFKVYTKAGKFEVSLKITDVRGCSKKYSRKDFIIVDGPVAEYSFNPNYGCVPLTVDFIAKTDENVFFEWDLGDGNLNYGKELKHVYQLPGQYIPALIVSDSQGCKYTMPPIDTIIVNDFPRIEIKQLNFCSDDSIKIKNNSISNHFDSEIKYKWTSVDGILLSEEKEPVFKFDKNKSSNLMLSVKNTANCSHDSLFNFQIHKPKIAVSDFKNQLCLGENLKLLNQSKSKFPLIKSNWYINDSIFENNNSIVPVYLTKTGLYQIKLIVFDSTDCKDTLKFNPLIVGDTFSPISMPILRVSVENDQTLELKFLKNQSLDFNQYMIYQWQNNAYQLIKQIKFREDTIHFINPLNTLKNSYCFKVTTQNFCNKIQSLNAIKEHCSVESKAEGQINSNLVKWNNYTGWPVEKYEVYREHLTQKGQYEYLATVNGNQLEYIDTAIACFVRYYYRILTHEDKGFNENSWSDTCAAQPIWLNKVAPNEIWRATVEQDEFVKLEWVFPNHYRVPLKEVLIQKIDPKRNTLSTSIIPYHDSNSFYDLKTKVHQQNYYYKTRVIDVCRDTSILSNVGVNILLKSAFDKTSNKPLLHWTAYQKWNEDVEYYIIERKNLAGQFERIGRTNNGFDTSFIDLTAHETCVPDYVYRVLGVRNQPTKTDSSFNVVSLSNSTEAFPESKLFMPNAFSPDNNQINEQFGPKGSYIKRYNYQVYDRWGEKLFETQNCLENWDGQFKGETCIEGVYLYRLEALGSDNKHYILKGTFTLLR